MGIKKKYTDHLGNEYSSLSEMCSNHGIRVSTYRELRLKGMSLEQALTTEDIEDNGVDRLKGKCRDMAASAADSRSKKAVIAAAKKVGDRLTDGYWKHDFKKELHK